MHYLNLYLLCYTHNMGGMEIVRTATNVSMM